MLKSWSRNLVVACVHPATLRSGDAHSCHVHHASVESRSILAPDYRRIQQQFNLNCTKYDRLKCDRARPCDNCVKRREADTCVYPINGSATRDQTRESKKTKKRLERLESLVMELLDRGALSNEALSVGPSTTSETDSQAHYHMPHQHSENGHETDSSPAQGEVPPVRRVSNLAASSSSHSLWETVLQDVS